MEPDKVHPKTGHEGTQEEKWCSSTLSVTSVVQCMGVQYHTPAALRTVNRHGTHYTGDWVGPRHGLDGCGKTRPPEFPSSFGHLWGERRFVYRVLVTETLRERDHL